MGTFQDMLFVVSIVLEIAVLAYLELKAWKTIYTPLNFLMLPYLAVLIITLMLAGSDWGFVSFYYPSILIWNVSLLIFAVPSLSLGFLLHKNGKCVEPGIGEVSQESMPKILVIISAILAVLFLWHLKGMLNNPALALGSDEFGEEFSGGGIWGHLRQLTIPLLIMCLYSVSKERWWLWPIIIVFVVVGLLNQVKSWVIIPVLAAVFMRLYTKKMRLTFRLMLFVVLGAMLVFFLSYALSILVVNNRGITESFMELVFGSFFHYLTSGTLGWSVDLENGLPDASWGSFENIIAQIVNLIRSFTGNEELVYPVNPLFYNTGITLTNVRTVFGTLYINSNWTQFVMYILFLSTSIYLIKIAMLRYNNMYCYTIYFFYCALLFMGWFDFFFSGLIILEFPLIAILFHVASSVVLVKKETK